MESVVEKLAGTLTGRAQPDRSNMGRFNPTALIIGLDDQIIKPIYRNNEGHFQN